MHHQSCITPMQLPTLFVLLHTHISRTYTMKKDTEASQRTRLGKHNHNKKRIVVLDDEKAKLDSEAGKYLQRQIGKCGRTCIELVPREDGKKVIQISEDACPVCLTRAKLCPGGAVKIVNLPSNLTTNTTHQYGSNGFKLHGLPMPRPGHVLGLLGCNGVGKTTALSILSGRLKPNLGVNNGVLPTWEDIVRYYRGSDLQNYFKKVVNGKLRCSAKAQLGPSFVQRYSGRKIGELVSECNQKPQSNLQKVVKKLELFHLLEREAQTLSGGERQRLSICLCVLSDADVYLFDEPSSFLDVKQRLVVAEVIRELCGSNKYVIVVEHDLTVLDYVSDYVCCLYGEPGAYGVVAQRSTAANGINQFIAGYLRADNIRFREHALSFQVAEIETVSSILEHNDHHYSYPTMSKSYGDDKDASSFTLLVEAGGFRGGEIVGLLGQNGCGKSTLTKMIGHHFSNNDARLKVDDSAVLGMSYKLQHVPPHFRTYQGSVEEFLNDHMQWGQLDRMFSLLVKKPLKIDNIKDLSVQSLSTGELQRLMICVCLGTPALLYLIDEPSAYLDAEMRLVVAKVIKRWVVSHLNKSAFVVEHDLIMASAMYDKVIVFEGLAGEHCTAKEPMMPAVGLNEFLHQLDVTVCHRSVSNRPRINMRGSRRDREQKKLGNYFALEGTADEQLV